MTKVRLNSDAHFRKAIEDGPSELKWMNKPDSYPCILVYETHDSPQQQKRHKHVSYGFVYADDFETLPVPVVYGSPLPDYGDVMTVKHFVECVLSGGFIDYDGFGHPVKDGKMDSDAIIVPSEVMKGEYLVSPRKAKKVALEVAIWPGIPADATHVVWFNR